jgi:hypothetical protein
MGGVYPLEVKTMHKGKAIGQVEYFATNLPTEFIDEWGGVWLRSGNIETDPAKFDDEYWKEDPITLDDYIHYEKGTTTTENLGFNVAHDGSLFVCCGSTHTILTSPDGVVWTEQTTPIVDPTVAFGAVTYGNGLFVVVGGVEAVSSNILTSPDGITWTEQTAPVGKTYYGIGFANGLFVACRGDGGITTSPDGITWTERVSPVDVALRNPTYGNGWWLATMYNTSDSIHHGVIKSTDGINWVKQDIGTSGDVMACGYGLVDGTPTWVVGGYSSDNNLVYVSNDTVNWVSYKHNQEFENLHQCIYSNGVFIMCSGKQGGIITSKDGIKWYLEPNVPVNPYIGLGSGMVGGKKRIVCVGTAGVILTHEPEDDPIITDPYAGIPEESFSPDGDMIAYTRVR